MRGNSNRAPPIPVVRVSELPTVGAPVVVWLPKSATADHGPCTFHDAETPTPFNPKHPQSPGAAFVCTHRYVTAASPLMPSCAIAGEASAKAPANNAAAKIKIFRIVILPISKLEAFTSDK
jgi:hypothetical protein